MSTVYKTEHFNQQYSCKRFMYNGHITKIGNYVFKVSKNKYNYQKIPIILNYWIIDLKK